MKTLKVNMVVFGMLFLGITIFAQTDLKIETYLDKSSYQVGDTVVVALRCTIPDNFHLYGNPLGPGIGKPLSLEVGAGENFLWVGGKKSKAKKFKPEMGDWVWAYEKETFFFITGRIKDGITNDFSLNITLDALICHTSCVPLNKNVTITIPIKKLPSNEISFADNVETGKKYEVAENLELVLNNDKSVPDEKLSGLLLNMAGKLKNDEAAIPEWDYDAQEKKLKMNIMLAIILAFFAGIILNVMPCVLPVLGIKILSFSQGAGSGKKVIMLRSLAFSIGMISIFIVLASFAAFAGLSWGEQFQKPKVLVGIVTIIFVFALGMFDVFMILVPTGISALEQKSTKGKGYLDDVFKGMFTTILATPCSGPLLGATLAWTLTQPPVIIYSVFISLGIGMASPYIVLSSSTRLMKLIPRPGTWMEDFKHVMGFLLFGFAVYLMIGLPKDMILPTVGFCVSMAFILVLYTRLSPFGSSMQRKVIVGFICLVIGFGGWHLNFTGLYNLISDEAVQRSEKETGAWEEFTPDKLIKAHSIGRHVIVDFTASWCMNCQFNKITVYHSKEIAKLIKDKNILALKADITQNNPGAESLLHHLGSRSVPFLAVFPKDDPYKPIIMRDLVKKKSVMQILQKLISK